MRYLKRARSRARACRAKINAMSRELLEALSQYLLDVHQIELQPVNSEFLKGGRAEVVHSEGCLFYDERFDRDPAEKLIVLLHELGHLEMHPRLKRRCTGRDPLIGSMYLNDGGPAIARYNKRSREEAEANAFATEFLCPSDEVFNLWLNEVGQNSKTLADILGAPVPVVQAQLAEGLYRLTLGGEAKKSERQEFDCDAVQEEAARFTGAPVLVNAGPGTGKTATLVRRIEYLIMEKDAQPDQILVLTFSTEAAEELTERIEHRFGSNIADEITVSTFHGFGVSFLLHHGQYRDVDANAYILDEAGQAELVTSLLGKVGCERVLDIKRPHETVEEIVRHIGFLKDLLHTPDKLAAELAKWKPTKEEQEAFTRAEEFLGIYRAYEREKAARKRLDFADLIALPIEILEKEKKVRAARREHHKWVLVDEYQDVSRSVARLLQLLCGAENPPWVVGDKRQAIFQFRGAAPENVAEFVNDFPGARVFELDINYRSSAEIVRAANQLAELLEISGSHGASRAEWKPSNTNPQSLGRAPVAVAVADSDQAEYEGVATQVREWRDQEVPLGDIAVLARRNLDVRNIVLALGRLGVQATTSGLVTADGAAGDLANIVTLADRPLTSLMRLAFSLGRGQLTTGVINKVSERLLATSDDDGNFEVEGYGEGDALAAQVARACECLLKHLHDADAFTAMCLFLFDGSDYLRRVLALPDGAEKALALSETVASLARAAIYRFTHQESKPMISRKGFGEHFRAALSSSVPCLMPPQSNVDAVRVMTCHASKGLEFSCVIVAGQTLSRAQKGYKWLPNSLQSPAQQDIDQANSVAFVGATRAKRALLVTYATSATGTELSKKRPRTVTPLLEGWQEAHEIPTTALPPVALVRETVTTKALWGGELAGSLSPRSLDKDACTLDTYVRNFLGARYPVNEAPLYRTFHAVVRYALRQIIDKAHKTGAPIGEAEAREILLEGWQGAKVGEHSHSSIYLPLALAYVERLARIYVPPRGRLEPLETSILEEETGVSVRLDLIAHYREDGESVAIMFRPESFKAVVQDKGLLWGKLGAGERVPFVLLRMRDPKIKPFVFSGEDGEIYPYLWGRDKDFANEASRVAARFKDFGKTQFVQTISEHKCDRCDSRLPCPHWLGAVV
jgi:ATP-dependent DNA helicase UvrD/PcrA